MHCVKKITTDLYWVGGTDRRLALFENAFPIPDGITYNSYLLMAEKTLLLDTVDHSVSSRFFENINFLLGDRPLDYVVINHMEPDHCATIGELLKQHPETTIVCSQKTVVLLKQFFGSLKEDGIQVVAEGDVLSVGRHRLTFIMAPMVHWPEVMVTYDQTDNILFSADAFGTFGAMNGNLYADEMEFQTERISDARRYYTNIVGKFGVQVQALLKKAAGLPVELLCPLHGPVWRKDIPWFVDKYQKWSSYTPEEPAVMIAYGSIYGHTENMADMLASSLSELGIQNIKMYDVSVTHASYILSEAFRCSHLVFASVTYNGGLFSNMEHLLLELKAHNLQNRHVALLENGSWGPAANRKMEEIFSGMKNMEMMEPRVTVKSSVTEKEEAQIKALAEEIAGNMKGN